MIDGRKLGLSAAAAMFEKAAKNHAAQTLLFNALRLNRPEARGLLLSDDFKFLSYCMSRRERSRAQILQDLWVCFELKGHRNGFFVEFGATNGLKNSNTWLLEKELGWKGILAEPNPFWHSDLAANRSSLIEHRCVSSKTGQTVEFIATDDTDPELSSMAAFSQADHFADLRSRGQRMYIETISLDDLLQKYDAPQVIDYLSVDTEGSELEILSHYSFRHQFRTISVENNATNATKLDNLLMSKGYRRVFPHLSQWDSWYISSDLRSEFPTEISAPDK